MAKHPEHLDRAGLELIARFEGWNPHLYNDPVGHCTAYYGHLVHYGRCTSADYSKWPRLTQAQGLDYLAKDMVPYENAVHTYINVSLTQGRFNALTSFTMNNGPGALADSTLRRKLNAGDYDSVPSELARWVYAGGRKLEGLVIRRRIEGELFASSDEVELPKLTDAQARKIREAEEYMKEHGLDPQADRLERFLAFFRRQIRRTRRAKKDATPETRKQLKKRADRLQRERRQVEKLRAKDRERDA